MKPVSWVLTLAAVAGISMAEELTACNTCYCTGNKYEIVLGSPSIGQEPGDKPICCLTCNGQAEVHVPHHPPPRMCIEGCGFADISFAPTTLTLQATPISKGGAKAAVDQQLELTIAIPEFPCCPRADHGKVPEATGVVGAGGSLNATAKSGEQQVVLASGTGTETTTRSIETEAPLPANPQSGEHLEL